MGSDIWVSSATCCLCYCRKWDPKCGIDNSLAWRVFEYWYPWKAGICSQIERVREALHLLASKWRTPESEDYWFGFSEATWGTLTRIEVACARSQPKKKTDRPTVAQLTEKHRQTDRWTHGQKLRLMLCGGQWGQPDAGWVASLFAFGLLIRATRSLRSSFFLAFGHCKSLCSCDPPDLLAHVCNGLCNWLEIHCGSGESKH